MDRMDDRGRRGERGKSRESANVTNTFDDRGPEQARHGKARIIGGHEEANVNCREGFYRTPHTEMGSLQSISKHKKGNPQQESRSGRQGRKHFLSLSGRGATINEAIAHIGARALLPGKWDEGKPG